MGIKLGSIIPARPVKIAQLRGQRLAVDGYNLLYQFLASIRQRDGMPLADAHGHTTSHLSGLLFRLSALAAEGLRFCLIFDGKPHALKKRVLDERRDRKIKAQAEWEAALAAGDLVKARTKAQQTSQLTPEMVTEAQELLDALGLPWVTAPSEGEAQAAAMMAAGVVDAAVSQDFDTLLFGAPRLLRNLTVSGRRKLPGRQAWVEVNPEELTLAGAIEATQLSHKQLVDMAILMGTDFNPRHPRHRPEERTEATARARQRRGGTGEAGAQGRQPGRAAAALPEPPLGRFRADVGRAAARTRHGAALRTPRLLTRASRHRSRKIRAAVPARGSAGDAG